MANTVVKVVTDDIADVVPTNIDMVDLEDSSEETSVQFTEINSNLARSNVPVDVLLQLAAQNGGKNFNIFVKSSESSSIPKKDPRAVQTALKEATEHFKHISNIRFTRTGTVIISTNDLRCAVDISKIASFLGVTVTTRVLWENISNRFLLFNIPVDIPLAEIGQEIAVENNLDILELRRFYRQGSTNDVSPVLITILGTVLPRDVKIWLSNQQVRQFIDRPRQCRKCFKYNHASAKCQSEQLCVTCSVQHDGPCTNPVKCNNCNEEHRSDYNQCPARLKEIEILKFKCNNFLSFVEARRQFAKKTEAKSFAKVTSKQVTDFEQFKTLIESRTNAMLKVIIDYIMQYSEKISEAIGTLSTTIMNCLAKLSDRSPDRRKRHNNGTSSNITMYGFELIKIDLNQPLEDQGPFIAVVHKLTDFIVKAARGDEEAKAICEKFQKYVEDHPDIVVIDPLPSIKKLTDRYTQYKSVVKELNKEADIFIPAFVELSTTNVSENMAKMKTAGVDFPIVCKPTLAHGSTAHQMSLIFNEEGLKDVVLPCVAQKFINHNAVLYKLFTIGNNYFMIERPSLKNFNAGDQKTIFFNSHDVSKPHSASELNELDDNDKEGTPYILPEKEKMDFIVEALYKCLGINLLGIDFIIDNKTGHYAVVDINVFPGYDEVDRFFQLLCELILKKQSQKISGESESECKPQLNQCVLTPRGRLQKFSFDFSKSDGQSKTATANIPQYLCCPVSNATNGLHSDENCVKIPCLSKTSVKLPHFHSQDCAQEDSGIETSDSCDEKKEPCHRTLKRPHSQILNSSTVNSFS